MTRPACSKSALRHCPPLAFKTPLVAAQSELSSLESRRDISATPDHSTPLIEHSIIVISLPVDDPVGLPLVTLCNVMF